MLSEPLRQQPHPPVFEQLQGGVHQLHTANVVIHELAYGTQRLLPGGMSTFDGLSRRSEGVRSVCSRLTGGQRFGMPNNGLSLRLRVDGQRLWIRRPRRSRQRMIW